MAKKPLPPKERVPITLRLDSDIHEALKIIGTLEMRSLNTQIEFFLRKSVLEYESKELYYDDSLDVTVQRIKRRMLESPSSGDE